jgi:hypothetical protein
MKGRSAGDFLGVPVNQNPLFSNRFAAPTDLWQCSIDKKEP